MSDLTTPKRLQKKAEPQKAGDAGNGRAAPQATPTNGQMGPFYAAGPAVSLGSPVQTRLIVGQPGDVYEQEAEAMADRVTTGGPAPALSPVSNGNLDKSAQAQVEEEEPVQAQAEEEEAVQAQSGNGRPSTATPTATAAIRSPGAGQPMSPEVRSRIEPRLGADLGGVRVHTNGRAQQAATSLGARAFTHGSDIFLNRGESPRDLRLMAHEATHVMQQGATAVRRQPLPDVQLLPGVIMEEINDYARHIPGYTLFTVIIGFNPLTGAPVERSAINLLEGLMGLVPFGTAVFDKLQEYGIIQDAFNWVEGQLNRLDLSTSRIERTLEAAWEDVRLLEGFSYNLQVLRRHFGRLYDDVVAFARTLVDHIITLIKAAALDLAEGLLADNRAYALLKKIIKYDPLRGETVEATTVEILEDFLLLIGKEQELAQMRERGTLQETADWLDTQFATFMGLLGQLRSLFSAAWDAIQPANLPDLAANLQNLVAQAAGFLQQVWDFASTVALKVLALIKNALLSWLSSFAHEVPGFHLVTVLLGRNPFTGEPVPRTAVNIIKGFITLLPGGAEKFQQMQETGTIPQAAQRIEGAMAELGITWEFVVGLFTEIWDSLSINDLIDPIGAFQHIIDRFGEPISRLFTFIRVVVEEIIKLILELMNFPTDIIARILNNAMQAFEDIKRDPVGFLKNMLEAVKLGFGHFFDNILQHLLSGVTDWLFGQLRKAGIEPPADLSLAAVLDFVLQVLGLSMERIWEKLAERIGQENVDRIRGAIDRLVGIWNFVRDVQERGVAAIWEYIQEQISGLWDMVLEQAKNWIVTQIIEKVTVKLLSMLDPTGIMAVVNSFIAFFNAVQSAIEYIREILQIVDDYVSTIAAVARGDIAPGADKMEQGLANAIPVAIGFLANQVGLGNMAEKIAEIVGGIRSYVDRALDWLLDRAVSTVQSVLRALGVGGEEEEGEDGPEGNYDGQIGKTVNFRAAGEAHRLWVAVQGAQATVMMASQEMPVTQRLDEYAQMANSLADEQKTAVLNLITQARQALTEVDGKADDLSQSVSGGSSQANTAEVAQKDGEVETAEERLANLLRQIQEGLGIAGTVDIPPQVDVEDSAGTPRIRDFQYDNRQGTFQNNLFASGVTLTHIAYNQTDGSRQRVPVGSVSLNYNITAVHPQFPHPRSAFTLVDRSDPDEGGNYRELRENFPTLMRQWYRDAAADSGMMGKIRQLTGVGLVHMSDESLTRGIGKWRFIHEQLGQDLGSNEKAVVEPVFNALPAADKDRIGQAWLDRWAQGTHLHHILPLNYGGANENFVPLSAGVHVGSGGVHPGFWTPLKAYLLGIKPKVEEAERANE
ncbi:MAG: DUF4157 domain-containing protein [Ardenticatenaceae bacterium]|nr:DUF4157 domain-containing protein [Ardenticatenaceae bacterium]